MNDKEVKYLGRDFGDFRESLVDFAKNYFPDTYNDFNETSPGMMFMEMGAYVGDVLSYYTDYQLRESLLSAAQERSNILDIANSLGYKAKATSPSHTSLSVYLWVPATGSVGSEAPDMRYALTIPQGMTVSGDESSIEFTTLEDANFADTGSANTTVSVYSLDGGNPDAFLIKTKVKAISGTSVTETYTITERKKFDKFKLAANDVIAIESVTDADGNTWYEVPYLAQDTIFEQVANKSSVDPTTSEEADVAPYLLKLRRTARRFTTRINKDNYTEVNFGAGVSTSPDDLIVPNPSTIGNVLEIGNAAQLDVSFDPANMMHTRAYGQAPSSALTIKYLKGGGLGSNVVSGAISKVVSNTINLDEDGLVAETVALVKASIAVTNEEPATGGRSAETNEEIRQNALGAYASQNRSVTKEDYISRVYAMPPKYGSIAKAYVAPDDRINNNSETPVGPGDANPLALNMYVLSYDNLNNLATTNLTTKKNLQTYLSQYRILTDGINIRNGFPINIGIDFEIVVLPSFNGKEVLAQTIDMIKKYFDIDKWQFNQPIMIGDLVAKMSVVEGVQAVSKIDIKNNASIDSGYSGNSYNIETATINNVVYPSQDPCIFEVKYPDKDIRGKIVGF